MIFPNEIPSSLPFALGGMLLALSLCFIILGKRLHKSVENEDYSFLSSFPFEIFPRRSKSASNGLKILFVAAIVMSLGPSFIFAKGFFFSPNGIFVLGLFASFLLLIKAISLGFLSFLPAYYHKAHVALDALSFFLSTASFFVAGYFLFKLNGLLRGVSFVLSILVMVVALIFPLIMLSPRYKDWVKLSNQEEAGEVVVKRPRFFILAASEWLLYLLSLLGDLLIYLSIGFLLLEM